MRIDSKRLVSLLECVKKYEIEKISLKADNMRYECIGEAIRLACGTLANGKGVSEAKKTVYEHLLEKYRTEWFLLEWQKEKAVEDDYALFERFLENFQVPVGARVRAQTRYEVPYRFGCHGKEFSQVGSAADLLVEHKDGAVTGVIVRRKFAKPFSYRACKSENKVMNSLELLFLMLALTKEYPNRPVEVRMVSLKSKADKAGVLAEFDAKPGDNVIGFTLEQYMERVRGGLVEGIKSAISDAQPCECRDCIFEDLCKSANKVFLKTKALKKLEGKKLKFTPRQREVIGHSEGPIRVCAGPGSGKTATIVARVQRLLDEGASPDEILAVTFTRKAAKELLDRIEGEDKPNVSTLHSLAFKLLTEHEELVGSLKLVNRMDCMHLLLSVLNDAELIKNASYEGLTMPYGLIPTLLKDFDFINKNGEDAFREAYKRRDVEGILNVKRAYDQMLRKAGFITYDEQVSEAVRLLREHDRVRQEVQERFTYVMVDEAQDLDEEQAELIRLVTNPTHNNLMICGDGDQSIYSFRGGSSRFMLEFPKIYQGAKDVWLDDNFRSSNEILETAGALIGNNSMRVPMSPRGTFPLGFKPVHIKNFHPEKIRLLIKDVTVKGYRYGDVAIIARNNKSLLRLCETINVTGNLEEQIPFERPKYYLYEDFVFQCLLDLLELYVKGMKRDSALYRLMRSLDFKPEKRNKGLTLYEDYLERGEIYDADGEEGQLFYMVADDDGPALQAFAKIYRAMKLFKMPLEKALKAVAGYFFDARINTTEALEKILEKVEERRISRPEELYSLLKNIKTFRDDTRLTYDMEEDDVVHLLTAHDAKGKEFPIVIVYGVDEFEGEEDVEEDRRLLYVAMTRAKRVLMTTEVCQGKSALLREFEGKMTVKEGVRYE